MSKKSYIEMDFEKSMREENSENLILVMHEKLAELMKENVDASRKKIMCSPCQGQFKCVPKK